MPDDPRTPEVGDDSECDGESGLTLERQAKRRKPLFLKDLHLY
jgi:hypothetical protein